MIAAEHRWHDRQNSPPVLSSCCDRGEDTAHEIESYQSEADTDQRPPEHCEEWNCRQKPHENTRNQMAYGHQYAMLLNYSNLPVSVLHLLPKEKRQRPARLIPASNPWRLPNLAAGPNEPKIELVVLISNQLLVEETNVVEDLASIDSSEHGIRGALVILIAPERSASREPAMVRCRDRLLHLRFRLTDHSAAHVVRASLRYDFGGSAEIVGRIAVVGARDCNVLAPRTSNSEIHCARGNKGRVINTCNRPSSIANWARSSLVPSVDMPSTTMTSHPPGTPSWFNIDRRHSSMRVASFLHGTTTENAGRSFLEVPSLVTRVT